LWPRNIKAETIFELAKSNKHRAATKYYKAFDTFSDVDLKAKIELSSSIQLSYLDT